MIASFIEYLHQVPLFNLLTEEEKYSLANHMQAAHYRMGETIIEHDAPADAFYIIVSGQARKIGLSDDNKETNLGLLHPGEHFGEQGLMSGGRSPLIIRASTSLQVIKIHREQFLKVLSEHPTLEKYVQEFISSDVLSAFLKNNTVFTHVDSSAIRSLLDHLEVRTYAPSEYLVREGEAGDSFYIMKSGTAYVEKGEESAIINRLYPGDFFGELALLTREPRKASIRAAEEVTVFRFSKSDFDELIVQYPIILESIRRISSHYSTATMPTLVHDEPFDQTASTVEVTVPKLPKKPFQWKLRIGLQRSYPALLQQNEMDCGPTCLTMIAQHYGLKASVNKMRERCNVGVEGTSMLSLTETAESLGFEAQGIKPTFPLLQDLPVPFIAHWNGNHYIVVYEVNSDRIVVADPAVGYVEAIPVNDFQKSWSGFVITLTPTERLVPLDDQDSLWQRYLPFFRPYRKLLISTLGLSILIELIFLVFPVMTQVIFDQVLGAKNLSMLHLLLIAMIALVTFNTVSIGIRQLLLGKLSYLIDRGMLDNFYRHLFSLPYTYFAKRTSGDIITRVYENEKIRRMLTDHGTVLLLDTLTLIVYGSLMIYYHSILAFISLLAMPLYLSLYLYMIPKLRRNMRKQLVAEGESQTQMVETINAIATIKGSSTEGTIRRKLLNKLEKLLILRLEGNRYGMFIQAGSTALRSLSNIALLYFGAHFVMNDELTPGGLVAFTVLFTSFMFALESISQMSGELSEVRISMERLNDVYESTVEHPDPDQMRMLPSIQGHIRLDNVSFRYYRGGKMILQQLNVEIQPGQVVALVGRSGSGKSTLANLLLKLLEPTSGELYIDGYPLKSVHSASIRRQVGVVPQEPVIFRGTVRENIALMGQGASLEEVEHASKLAGAHEFIEGLPLGYDTMIGEGGIRLSGGQRQRIVIARALLHDPRILIFDEATSALDTESERIIQQNMDTMLKNRTTLVIAHRLSTIRHADLILVLDQGTIAERGTHDELMAKKGMYYYFVNQQSLSQ